MSFEGRPYLFLSYAHADSHRVDQVVDGLRARGFPVVIDREMPAGVEWAPALDARAQGAYAVVVVWSSQSVASEPVKGEAMIGFEKNRLYPISLDPDVRPPSPFDKIHAADLSRWNGNPKDQQFERALALLRDLWVTQNGLLQPVKAMRPLRFR